MLTTAQYQALITLQVGDTPTGDVATNLTLLWDAHDGNAPALQFLLAKRDAVDIVLRWARDAEKIVEDDEIKVEYADRIKVLLEQRKALVSEIATASSGAPSPASSARYLAGPLRATVPGVAASPELDPRRRGFLP